MSVTIKKSQRPAPASRTFRRSVRGAASSPARISAPLAGVLASVAFLGLAAWLLWHAHPWGP